MSLESIQFILMTVSDILILLLLVYILIKIPRKDSPAESEQLTALKSSFEKLMKDSENISTDLVKSFEKRIHEFNDIISELDQKYTRIRLDILKSIEITEKLNNTPLSADITDAYKKAVDLLAAGTDPKEIQKITGLDENEIELVRRLARHKND